MSRTAALGRVPLTWENAFGGHDETRSTPERAVLEPRNPVGTGFGKPLTKDGDHLRLPNIEDPNQLIGEYGAVVAPCGLRLHVAELATSCQVCREPTTSHGTRPGNRCCRSISIDGFSMPRHQVLSRPDICEGTRRSSCSTPRRFLDWRFACRALPPPRVPGRPARPAGNQIVNESRHGHREHRRAAVDPALACLRAGCRRAA